MEETDQGAFTPHPSDGLAMLIELAESLVKFNLIMMPLLIGLKGDPGMGFTDPSGAHMIGYAVRGNQQPQEEPPAEECESEALDKIFGTFFGDLPGEED